MEENKEKVIIYIFSNKDAIKEVCKLDVSNYNFSTPSNIVKEEINDISVYLFYDSLPLGKLREIGKKTGVCYPNYIALHESKQGNQISEYKREYPKSLIKSFSHISDPDNFFTYILKKIKDKSLTIGDINRFFISQDLLVVNILHQIYNGRDINKLDGYDNLDKELKKIFEKFKKELSPYFNYDDDQKQDSLKRLSDEINESL